MPVLEVKNLTKYFGGLAAVSALDMDVSEGEILGLIGPNGAGKSTVLNMLGGNFQPSEGGIIYKGKDLKSITAKGHKDLVFYFTSVNDPHFMIFFIKISLQELIENGSVKTETPKDLDRCSVYTLQIFDKYVRT